jgi:hypothetical protein
MSRVETVKVEDGEGGYVIINKSDYDEKKHKMIKSKGGEHVENAGALGVEFTDRGVKNPSGTYSEPTPTDIRYPNKDQTEFENNHGAHVGKSAAQIRKAKGLPDKPGGIQPNADVEIPDDWRKMKVKERKALAAQLGGEEDNMSAADANELIQSEVDRRAARDADEEDVVED